MKGCVKCPNIFPLGWGWGDWGENTIGKDGKGKKKKLGKERGWEAIFLLPLINIENYEYIFGMYRIDDNFQNFNGMNDNVLEVTEIKL